MKLIVHQWHQPLHRYAWLWWWWWSVVISDHFSWWTLHWFSAMALVWHQPLTGWWPFFFCGFPPPLFLTYTMQRGALQGVVISSTLYYIIFSIYCFMSYHTCLPPPHFLTTQCGVLQGVMYNPVVFSLVEILKWLYTVHCVRVYQVPTREMLVQCTPAKWVKTLHCIVAGCTVVATCGCALWYNVATCGCAISTSTPLSPCDRWPP